MKIALIDVFRKKAMPVGLISIGTVLEKEGYSVRLFKLYYYELLGHLKIDKDYFKNAAKLVAKYNAEIIGFSCMCDSYQVVLSIAEECKKLNPDIKIIFGGPQATLTDAETLRTFSYVDIIVRGEGELTVSELIRKIKSKESLETVKGITYRNKKEIVRNSERDLVKDLGDLPDINYDFVFRNYEFTEIFPDLKDFEMLLEVGRGCPHKCIYCATTLLWKRRYRLKPFNKLYREMMIFKRKYNIRKFALIHDAFTANRNRVIEFCQEFKRTKTHIVWSCSARVDHMDREMLYEMETSGCTGIYYGIETGDKERQISVRKLLNLDKALKVIKSTNIHNINQALSFIIGFPGETYEELNKTLKFALKCYQRGADAIYFSLLAPLAGTEIYNENKHRMMYVDKYSSISPLPFKVGSELNRIDLVKQHPELFSSFYVIRTDKTDMNLLMLIENTFHILLSMFRVENNFFKIFEEMELEPIDFFRKLNEWIKNKKITEKQFYKGIEGFIAEFMITYEI